MAWRRRVKAALFELVVRAASTRQIDERDLERKDFSRCPGGKGLRFNERLRDAFRGRWLRIRK